MGSGTKATRTMVHALLLALYTAILPGTTAMAQTGAFRDAQLWQGGIGLHVDTLRNNTDADNDVDFFDFAEFQSAFTGR